MRICLVTDRRLLAPEARTQQAELLALEAFVVDAIAAGVDLIQIRERDLEARALMGLTRQVVAHAAGTSVRVLVNDRADIAVAAGADGVHLRGDGPPGARIRDVVGPGALVGRSIHSTGEADDAVDFFVFGTVFETTSKPDGAGISGLAGLAAAARRASVPVLAIGGITPERVAECRAAGAMGIAAISVFLPPGRSPNALGPSAAVAALRSRWT